MPLVGNEINDLIVMRDYNNVALTGLTAGSFATLEAYATASPGTTTPVILTEIGAGEYEISFTPTTPLSGPDVTWNSHVIFDAGGVFREFSETYSVSASRPNQVLVITPPPPGAFAQSRRSVRSEMITRGDSITWDLPILDDAGDPFDLTGSTVWFSVKQRFNQPDSDAVVSTYWVDGGTSSGITVDDPVTGEISYGITAAQSSDLIASLYHADVQVLDANANVTTVWRLRLAIGAGVTDGITVP